VPGNSFPLETVAHLVQRPDMRNPTVGYIASISMLVLALIVVATFFESLPIEQTSLAIDWKGLWPGLKGGSITYTTGLRIPPWSALVVLPLGLISFRASWGVLTFATLALLILSIPKTGKAKYLVSIFVLALSFPTLRTIADGNFEALTILGVLFIIKGISEQKVVILMVGVLLAASKIQESWILLLLLIVYVQKQWSAREWLVAILTLSFVCVPTLLWKGGEWWDAVWGMPQRGSIMDCSLLATSARLQFPFVLSSLCWACVFVGTLVIILKSKRQITREKAGFMMTASLLLSPYAAGNSFLAVYAIGIIPLFHAWSIGGVALIGLANLSYFALGSTELVFHWGATFWTAVLLFTWGVFAFKVMCQEIRPGSPTSACARLGLQAAGTTD
jgi:hypothetical protein